MSAPSESTDRTTSTPDRSSDLLLAAAAGDGEAFGDFYRATSDDILRFFFRRTACPHVAADLTAETFAQALISLPGFRPTKGSGRRWIFGIARHQLTRFLRRRRAADRARRRLGMPEEAVLDEVSIRRIERFDEFTDIRSAVAGLSPKLAAAVELRIGAELPYQQVAERLGCSEATARTRVSRALSILMDKLESPE